MTRCLWCGRRLWPWQPHGWWLVTQDYAVRWHRQCLHDLWVELTCHGRIAPWVL